MDEMRKQAEELYNAMCDTATNAGYAIANDPTAEGQDVVQVVFRQAPMFPAHAFSLLSAFINGKMRQRGFWDGDDGSGDPGKRHNDSEKVMLVVTELAEGVEGLRKGNGPSEHIPDFNCMEEEYADAIIRILDHCAQRGWRIGQAIEAKMRYNLTRPHKHGKAF